MVRRDPDRAGRLRGARPRLVDQPAKRPTFTLVAPNPRTTVYVEVDDAEGREFGAVLPLAVEEGDPMPKAHLAIPSLAPGPHWLVTSGHPRGAEHMSGATLARPFIVVKRVSGRAI